jgi:endonuclease YncB( thermonuclease family)
MPRFLAHAVLLGMAVACTACATDDVDLVIDATLVDVVDGDTLRVQLRSGPETVRLYGVDAPEARAPFGREATKALRALVAGGAVQLQPVADDPYDKYDRLIAVVYARGINVNETLVADGMAWAYRRYLGQLDGDAAYCDLEASARAAQRGLWSQPAERWVPPWIWRRRQGSPPGARVPSRDYARETAADCKAAIGRGSR